MGWWLIRCINSNGGDDCRRLGYVAGGVIVGAGHAPILRELVGADAAMSLVEPMEFLPEE